MGRKLKILFAVDEIYPDRYGGAHIYIYETAKRLAAKGHQVFILAKKINPAISSAEIIDGIQVIRYNHQQSRLSFLAQISAVINVYREFKKLNKDHTFDLINFHSPHAALGINLHPAAREPARLYTFHALVYQEEFFAVRQRKYKWYRWRRYLKPLWLPFYFFLLRWLEKTALGQSDKIIALSNFTIRCLTDTHNINKNKIIKIPAGVDTEKFNLPESKTFARKKLNLPLDKLILLTVRRLVSRMGLENLIKAMPAVISRYPDTVLFIVGQGPLKARLQSLADGLSLQKHIFLAGFAESRKLPFYYRAANLFILPTLELEGFGLVTLEALASGLPVLGTPVGATVEILGKLDPQLLFKDTYPESIASKIISYLPASENLAATYKKYRKFTEDNYSWELVAGKIEELFLEISKDKFFQK